MLIQGNTMEKGAHSENPATAIAIGEEGVKNPTAALIVRDNVFHSDGPVRTTFVRNTTSTPVELAGNTITGRRPAAHATIRDTEVTELRRAAGLEAVRIRPVRDVRWFRSGPEFYDQAPRDKRLPPRSVFVRRPTQPEGDVCLRDGYAADCGTEWLAGIAEILSPELISLCLC